MAKYKAARRRFGRLAVTAVNGLCEKLEKRVKEYIEVGSAGLEADPLKLGLSAKEISLFVSWDQSGKVEKLLGSDEKTRIPIKFLSMVGRSSSSCEHLDLRPWELTEFHAIALWVNLRSNTILKRLQVTCPPARFVDVLADFHKGDPGPEYLLLIEKSCVEYLASMIRMNNSLTTLRLKASISAQLWNDMIFAALKENQTLQELDLTECFGLEERCLQALLDLIRSRNTQFTNIVLAGTKLERWQSAVNEELRVNREYRAKLRDQTTVQAVSGRLVLCGYAFAGKTAILKTMERIEQGLSLSEPIRSGWKKLFPGHGSHTARTRGVNVVRFKTQRYLKYIWDFAGQKEFYAVHDYVFPNIENSCFLYVCSSRGLPDAQNRKGVVKSRETMKSECEFWMKFIASNSKPLQSHQSRGHQLPSVRFVLTKKDTLNSKERSTSINSAEHVVRELREAFKGVVDLCDNVEVVDAHSSKDVKHLFDQTDITLKGVLADQKEYAICEEVRKGLRKLSVGDPIMSVEDFQYKFADPEVKEAVLAYFNDIGEVISPRGFNFLADPRWFGIHVLGFLIKVCRSVEDLDGRSITKSFHGSQHGAQSWELIHDHGYVDIRDMRKLLNNALQTTTLQQRVSADKLIELMIQMELCLKKEPGNVDSPLFLPALFDDVTETAAKGERQLDWKLVQTGTLCYLGRRLECENKVTTFLTPGFFPRLQVHLHNYIHEKTWTKNPGFAIDRNLICFADNGIEVLVEYSGDVDYFVDILVRSSKAHSLAREFMEKHVIRNILDFCASPQGCQGVMFVEAVIRPVCVRDLHLCAKRKDHSVLVSALKGHLEKDDGYTHTWHNKMEDVSDTDLAIELLQGKGAHGGSITSPHTTSSTPMGPGCSSMSHFPTLFYPSIDNVSVLRALDTRLNLARKMAIKLHLLCDHADGCHKVENQPGRTVILNWRAGACNVHISKLALTLLWSGVGFAATMAGVRLPQVDNWIDGLYNVPEMPDIDAETLHQMMSHGKRKVPISNQQILKAWEQYLKIDPNTQGLKEILNLDDGTKFWTDFRLHKVEYTDAPNEGRIGWVCDRHHRQGLQQKILRSKPH